jgi:polyisoprenoid-binding protein YceI
MQQQHTSVQPVANSLRQFVRRPYGKVALGLAAALLIALSAGAIYVFGAPGSSRGGGPLASATMAPSGGATVFTIDSSASQATFTIDEVLFGQPNTVVGKTNQVAGQIRVNFADPSESQVGQIRVDVSTLVTDNDFRNRTMQGRILETGDAANQYATFAPTAISGLPETITMGQPVSFKITGQLTIHQVTRTATFDAQVTPVSQKQLTGQAQTTVRYQDFNMVIPNVPSVTGVSDEVKLALTFTARA